MKPIQGLNLASGPDLKTVEATKSVCGGEGLYETKKRKIFHFEQCKIIWKQFTDNV